MFAAARELADQHAPLVADALRGDVLVALGGLGDRVHVHPALVGERAAADERLVAAVVQVGHLVDVARQLGQPLDAAGPQHLVALLLRAPGWRPPTIRSALPQRSPKPLIVPCTCTAPASTAASELATATSQSLWQWMPTGTRSAARGRRRRPRRSPRAGCRRWCRRGRRASAPASAAACTVRRAYSGLRFQPSKKCSAS